MRSPDELRSHIAATMAFYHPRCIDPAGGFFHYFKDNGSIYDARHRHLVSSTRFIYNYAMAAREFGAQEYVAAVQHGVSYLRDVHRDPVSGGYFWTLRDGEPEGSDQHAYGAAFVLLAYACALKAGIERADDWIAEHSLLLESHYWDPEFGLYRDEATRDWEFTDYRGQNANMHMCEAQIAAYEATGETRFRDRALLLAEHICRRQTTATDGLVWEHFDSGWRVDWDYNRDDRKNLFRPWGFQTGHQTEWAKLLLTLHSHLDGSADRPVWLLETAQTLFDRALKVGWDTEYGGLIYGFAPVSAGAVGRPLTDGYVACDEDKYFWVCSESIAAAARLALATGEEEYWRIYDRLWSYADAHLIDHRYGAWYRILDREGNRYSDEKSPAGKTDYHTMGACHDVLAALRSAAR